MRVTRVHGRSFRSYERLDVSLGAGLTVVHGANGEGKTNLLEAIYFGCTGQSCRTSNERELVSFGAEAAYIEVEVEADSGAAHTLSVGFSPGAPKQMKVDGAPVEGLLHCEQRPLVSVFLPDRLELIKGPPALRRAHADQVIAAAWPTRRPIRRAYGQALSQRNALLAGIRSGRSSVSSLRAWDRQLATTAIALRDHRAELCQRLEPGLCAALASLGLAGTTELQYRPRTHALDVDAFVEELAQRTESDVERGFSGHGPHRDDIAVLRDGRDLRIYGSQGEQRLTLLALLLAERDLIADLRGVVPLLLLDDVMSELDATRRGRLSACLRSDGQTLITTTDVDHIPDVDGGDVTVVGVSAGSACVAPRTR